MKDTDYHICHQLQLIRCKLIASYLLKKDAQLILKYNDLQIKYGIKQFGDGV